MRSPRFSYTQLRLLHNLAIKIGPYVGVRGAASHGGFGQTIQSMLKRDLMVKILPRDTDNPTSPWKLTRAGATVHREQCCSRGVDPDDILVEEVETVLTGKGQG